MIANLSGYLKVNVLKKKKKKTKVQKILIHHRWNKRTGLYKFLGKNFVKLLLILSAIVALIFVIDAIFDLRHQQEVIKEFVYSHNTLFVLFFFYLTESIMGLIPPDIFIVWAKARYVDITYLVITGLATISYLGGITAYYLGILTGKFKRIENYIKRRYGKHFDLITKWGGLVVIMAALFPLPFAMISTIAGMVRYPIKRFLLYGLTRYIRFYLYAIVIFGALKNIL